MFGLNRNNRPKFYSIVTCIMLAISVVFFVVLILSTSAPDYSFHNDNVYLVNQNGILNYHDVKINAEKLPFFEKGERGDVLIYTTTLTQPDDDSDTILFHVSHQKCKVFVDDVLISSFGHNPRELIGKTPCHAWLMIKLPNGFQGSELRIELETVYENYGLSLGEIYIGSKTALIYQVAKKGLLGFLLEIPILILGLGLLIIGVFFHKNKLASRRIIYLGVFALLASSWMIIEEGLTQFIFKEVIISYGLSFIIYSMFPIVLLRFLMTYGGFAKSKYIKVIYWISIINFFCIHFLQIFKVSDYAESNVLNHLIILAIIAGCIGIYFNEKSAEKNQKFDIFAAAFVYGIFGAIDILRFYAYGYKDDVLFFTKIGMLCFIIILGCSAIRQISKEHENAIQQQAYKTLAYTDMMTNMPNRTAFEERMEELRTSGEKSLIAIADINNLKYINDSFGHRAGDEAICIVGKSLSDTMGKHTIVYRIGGDEYCAIADLKYKDEFVENYSKIQEQLHRKVASVNYPLVIACGYVLVGEEGIDKAFIDADYKMYQEKLKLKENQYE